MLCTCIHPHEAHIREYCCVLHGVAAWGSTPWPPSSPLPWGFPPSTPLGGCPELTGAALAAGFHAMAPPAMPAGGPSTSAAAEAGSNAAAAAAAATSSSQAATAAALGASMQATQSLLQQQLEYIQVCPANIHRAAHYGPHTGTSTRAPLRVAHPAQTRACPCLRDTKRKCHHTPAHPPCPTCTSVPPTHVCLRLALPATCCLGLWGKVSGFSHMPCLPCLTL